MDWWRETCRVWTTAASVHPSLLEVLEAVHSGEATDILPAILINPTTTIIATTMSIDSTIILPLITKPTTIINSTIIIATTMSIDIPKSTPGVKAEDS